MCALRRDEEVLALHALREAQRSGAAATPVAADLLKTLSADRLISADDYGGFQLTERGHAHLATMSRRGITPERLLARRRRR